MRISAPPFHSKVTNVRVLFGSDMSSRSSKVLSVDQRFDKSIAIFSRSLALKDFVKSSFLSNQFHSVIFQHNPSSKLGKVLLFYKIPNNRIRVLCD